MREQQSLSDATVVLIEDTRYQPTSDKIMRLHAQTALIVRALPAELWS